MPSQIDFFQQARPRRRRRDNILAPPPLQGLHLTF
jgi:hypothetical protein